MRVADSRSQRSDLTVPAAFGIAGALFFGFRRLGFLLLALGLLAFTLAGLFLLALAVLLLLALGLFLLALATALLLALRFLLLLLLLLFHLPLRAFLLALHFLLLFRLLLAGGFAGLFALALLFDRLLADFARLFFRLFLESGFTRLLALTLLLLLIGLLPVGGFTSLVRLLGLAQFLLLGLVFSQIIHLHTTGSVVRLPGGFTPLARTGFVRLARLRQRILVFQAGHFLPGFLGAWRLRLFRRFLLDARITI